MELDELRESDRGRGVLSHFDAKRAPDDSIDHPCALASADSAGSDEAVVLPVVPK
jgi:hypothetical protein